MENLIQTSTGEVSITLKEITDLIDVRHDRAMQKVDELTKESSFGTVSKIDIVYNDKNQTIPTYQLNKKQAIAVGAKLNNALLMKVIDRVEELENNKKPMTQLDMIIHSAKQMQKIESKQIDHDKRLENLEDTKIINTRQRKSIKDAIAIKIYGILKDNNLPKTDARAYFPKLHRYIRNTFIIDTYQELPSIKYNDCMNLIHRANLTDLLK